MSKTKHFKRYLKNNIYSWVAIGNLSMIGLFAFGNLLFAEPYIPADVKIPRTKTIKLIEIKPETTIREVTAYNAGVEAQTDDTPCIGASGDDICQLLEEGKNICAANFVPLGSLLYIEKIGECLVLDRMAEKFKNRVDVAMRSGEIERALKFGKQNLAVSLTE